MMKEDTYTRIMEAAIDLVGEHGYKGATTRLIAERSNVNEVTIFRKFGSKQNLLDKAITYVQTQIAEIIQSRSIAFGGDSRQDLTNMLLSLMELLTSKRETVAAILFEANREPFTRKAASAMVTFVMGAIKQLLSRFPEMSDVSEDQMDSLAVALLSFVFARVVLRERVLGTIYDRFNRSIETRNLVDFLVSGSQNQSKQDHSLDGELK